MTSSDERLQGFPSGWTDVPYKGKEQLEAKVQADADYIGDLEQSVKELEEENARLRGVLGSYAKTLESWAAENNGNGRYMDGPDWMELANELRMERDGI